MAKKSKVLTRKSLPTLKHEEEEDLPNPDVEKEEEKLTVELKIDTEKVLDVAKKEVEEQLKPKEWCNQCNCVLTHIRGNDWKCEKCERGWSF